MRASFPLTCLALTACGGAQTTGGTAEPPRPLDEARAIELAVEVFGEYGAEAEGHREVHLGTVDFEVDVAVPGKPVGVEILTDQDRATLGGALGRSRSGELRVIAVDERRRRGRIEVLFLDDTGYRYDPNPIESQGGATTIQEVEGRFRRDVRDYLEHERTAGHL